METTAQSQGFNLFISPPSDAVNGIGDFADDYTNDDDLDARNKMFEEVSPPLTVDSPSKSSSLLGLQSKPVDLLHRQQLRKLERR